ncbi:PilZ domain-containing protein [Cohnella panacarvi]|uniref:PilZ domain-containing protein n=1 Tax=Cohnella panacarvi TaxID=400776 RepID=UPI00047A2149|nr:PilZ domain-containing protein [Cohnella panacarvi]
MDSDEPFNRRKYIRFGLYAPLYAELSLHRVGAQYRRSRSAIVLLDNISFGGCLFRTNLIIPPREDVEWLLRLRFGRYAMHAKAIVVRSGDEEGYNLYGAKWKLSAYERHLFQYRLNEYLQATYVFAPHIQTLYRQVMERTADQQFKKFDIIS